MKKKVLYPALFVPVKIPDEEKITPDITFGDYGRKWLEESKWELAEKTYRRYESLFNRIDQGLGHITLRELQPYHIKAFIKRLRSEGINLRTGGVLSDKTILHHYRLISVILHQATLDEILTYNPACKERIKTPKVIQNEVECLQLSEIKQLILKLDDLEPEKFMWKTATLILLFTGIRRGELLGLEWRDIDFERKTLSISRTSQYTVENGIYTKEPKTKSSVRTYTLSDRVLQIFKNYREWYIRRYGEKGLQYKRLFVKKDGTPLHPDSISNWLAKYAKRNNLRRATPHILRHTYISLMIALGVPIKEISQRVGHSKLSTTCNIYSHCLLMSNTQAANALDDIIDMNLTSCKIKL